MKTHGDVLLEAIHHKKFSEPSSSRIFPFSKRVCWWHTTCVVMQWSSISNNAFVNLIQVNIFFSFSSEELLNPVKKPWLKTHRCRWCSTSGEKNSWPSAACPAPCQPPPSARIRPSETCRGRGRAQSPLMWGRVALSTEPSYGSHTPTDLKKHKLKSTQRGYIRQQQAAGITHMMMMMRRRMGSCRSKLRPGETGPPCTACPYSAKVFPISGFWCHLHVYRLEEGAS